MTTSEFDVIESLIETVARLYEILKNQNTTFIYLKEERDRLKDQLEDMENKFIQMTEQNKLLLQDIQALENKINEKQAQKRRDPKTGKFARIVKNDGL